MKKKRVWIERAVVALILASSLVFYIFIPYKYVESRREHRATVDSLKVKLERVDRQLAQCTNQRVYWRRYWRSEQYQSEVNQMIRVKPD